MFRDFYNEFPFVIKLGGINKDCKWLKWKMVYALNHFIYYIKAHGLETCYFRQTILLFFIWTCAVDCGEKTAV